MEGGSGQWNGCMGSGHKALNARSESGGDAERERGWETGWNRARRGRVRPSTAP